MNMYLLEFRATSIGFSIGIGVWVTQELNQLELKKKKKKSSVHIYPKEVGGVVKKKITKT